MVKKEFTLEQLNKKVNELYAYVDERELKLSSGTNNIETIERSFDQVDEILRQLRKLPSVVKSASEKTLEDKQNEILAQSMLTLSHDELIALSDRMKQRSGKIKTADSDNTHDKMPH